MAENVDAWDATYIDLDDTTLFHLVTAANYLMIRPLMELAYPIDALVRYFFYMHLLQNRVLH